MSYNFKTKLVTLMLLLTVSTTSMFFAAPKKGQAFWGAVTGIDPVRLVEEIAEAAIFSILHTFNERYTQRFVDQAMNKYQIQNVLEYTNTLAEEVYTSAQYANRAREDIIAIRTRIDQMKKKPATDQSGNVVSTKEIAAKQAKEGFDANDVDPSKMTAADYDLAIQAATNVLNTTSYGRELIYTAEAQEIMSTAYEAARLTQEGSGVKGGYTCQKGATNNELEKTMEQAQYVQCVTRYAPEYVQEQISSKINALFTSQLEPPTYVYSRVIGTFLGATVAKKLGDKILK